MSAAPRVSVVVAFQKGQPVERCLASLVPQEVQIVVAAASDAGGVPALAPPHVVFRSDRRSLPFLMGEAIARAVHPLIAFTEAHCTFDPEWAGRAVVAMSDGCAAAGGTVARDPALDLISEALYWADYAAFAPPLARRRTPELPGNNIVFQREALPLDASASGFWKTFHCRELERRGAVLKIDPSMTVTYGRAVSLAELVRRRYHHGRCFGGMRAGEIGRIRRLSIAAAAPLLPWVVTARLLRRAGDGNRGRINRLLHWVFLAQLVWIGGEAVGNAAGIGASCGEL
jgi:hypothetical protein